MTVKRTVSSSRRIQAIFSSDESAAVSSAIVRDVLDPHTLCHWSVCAHVTWPHGVPVYPVRLLWTSGGAGSLEKVRTSRRFVLKRMLNGGGAARVWCRAYVPCIHMPV